MFEPSTIHFVSLGCPKNRVDTEVMLGVSDQSGHRLVGAPEDADVIVVNTCGFIDAAKEESVNTILEMGQLRHAGRCRKLVVTGCLAQRYPEELAAELPEVDHFLGSSDMLELESVLRQSTVPRMLVGNPVDHLMSARDPRRLSQRPHSAYVKIAEGCNRSCAFCSIPSFRGRQRSRPVADVRAEVERLVAQGVVEVNLISQDTVAYGRDLPGRPRLAQLLEAVADVKGLHWVRLFYLYPEKLDDALLELIRGHERVLPYIDMPLQHVATPMLRRMRRGHGEDRLRQLVRRLRERLPHMVFRTAFIVGHPGESDADFEALLSFVRWAKFDRVGVFRFSPEEGTASYAQPDPVDAHVVEERYHRLMDAQRSISRAAMRARLGQKLEVLVEGQSDESEFLLEGRYWGQAPDIDGKVYLASGTAQPGELRQATVTHAADYDLVADLHDEAGRPPPRIPGTARTRRLPVVSG